MTLMRYTRRPSDFFTNQLINQLFRETQENFKSAIERDNNFRPGTNVIEEDDYYLIEMSIPGFSKQEVKINVENGKIRISGVKKTAKGDKKYLRKEFGNESFERSFNLSDRVSQENISAEVIDGVLNIILPKIKKEEPKVQNIEIK